MSLRWSMRNDIFQRGDEQFNFCLIRKPGFGVSLVADVLWYDDDGSLCQQSCFETKTFDCMSACDMFLSRKKKEFKIPVDGLLSRTYYFGDSKYYGRQNSRY